MSESGKRLAIARLREEIRRIEHRPARRQGAIACGVPTVDAALPAGGFPRGALCELAGGMASGKTAVALSLLARIADEGLFAWVDGRGELYPPAAAAQGVALDRLLVVRPRNAPADGGRADGRSWREALWACEALLASGAFAAVVMDVSMPRALAGASAVEHRLQAAAERGGTIGLWLTAPNRGLRIAAAVRLELSTEGGRIIARRALGAPATGARGSGRAA